MSIENTQDNNGQSGIDQETERRNRENETGEQTTSEDNFAADKQGSEDGSGFVGSSEDKSSDYLTKGENQDFAPEGQGASDTNAGTSDIETGQSSNVDATLDDGADTSQ